MWVNTTITRFWLEQGKIEKPLLLICEMGILPRNTRPESLSIARIHLDHPIPYRLMPAYLNLTRLLLLLGDVEAVLTISECLLQDAYAWGWGKVAIELLVMKALAYHAKKDTSSSLAVLDQAIASAWSEQSKRVFIDQGEPMGKLLYQASARGIGGEFVTDVLTQFGQQVSPVQSAYPTPQEISPGTETGPSQYLLVEPLSDRELEVLRHIADGCSNQEIADRLVLSLLTVKRHISNIYAKLEAKNRTQAVSLARSLKLID
jgi:LuxR family maltose regulon positive regulatory protein